MKTLLFSLLTPVELGKIKGTTIGRNVAIGDLTVNELAELWPILDHPVKPDNTLEGNVITELKKRAQKLAQK